MSRMRLGFLTATAFLFLAACATSNEPRFLIGGGGGVEGRDIRIEVVNDNYLDMGVFVMSDGANIRLGDVTGKTSETFTFDLGRVSPSMGLRLLADPVGSRNAFLSDAVAVNPGTTVVLNIAPNLQQSYVILR